MAVPVGARIASSRKLCGYCGTVVSRHQDSHEDHEPGKPPQLYHLKKCWPKEKRRRHKARRQVARQARRAELLAIEHPDAATGRQVVLTVDPPPLFEATAAAPRPAPLASPPPPPPHVFQPTSKPGYRPRRKEPSVEELARPRATTLHMERPAAGAAPILPPGIEMPTALAEPPKKRMSQRVPSPVKPIIKNVTKHPSRFQGSRNLMKTIEGILDKTQGYFTHTEILAQLAKHGLTTTANTVKTAIWQYAKDRQRPYKLFRHEGQSVYEFLLSLPEPEPEPEPEAPLPVTTPEPPPPVSGPQWEAVERELNDFQVMVIDMLVQLRADLRTLLNK